MGEGRRAGGRRNPGRGRERELGRGTPGQPIWRVPVTWYGERCQERTGASRSSLQPTAAAAAARSWASVRGAGGRRVVGGGGCWRLWSGQLGRLLSLWFPLWLLRGCGAADGGRGREREA